MKYVLKPAFFGILQDVFCLLYHTRAGTAFSCSWGER